MSILAHIRAHGGDAEMRGWRPWIKRRGTLSTDAIEWIKANRDDLAREIWPEFDEWEERAAIREFDGGQPRAEAEEAAYREVMGC